MTVAVGSRLGVVKEAALAGGRDASLQWRHDTNGEYLGATCDGVFFPKAELEQSTDFNPTPPSYTGCDTSYAPSTGRQIEVNLKMSRLHADRGFYSEVLETTGEALDAAPREPWGHFVAMG